MAPSEWPVGSRAPLAEAENSEPNPGPSSPRETPEFTLSISPNTRSRPYSIPISQLEEPKADTPHGVRPFPTAYRPYRTEDHDQTPYQQESVGNDSLANRGVTPIRSPHCGLSRPVSYYFDPPVHTLRPDVKAFVAGGPSANPPAKVANAGTGSDIPGEEEEMDHPSSTYLSSEKPTESRTNAAIRYGTSQESPSNQQLIGSSDDDQFSSRPPSPSHPLINRFRPIRGRYPLLSRPESPVPQRSHLAPSSEMNRQKSVSLQRISSAPKGGGLANDSTLPGLDRAPDQVLLGCGTSPTSIAAHANIYASEQQEGFEIVDRPSSLYNQDIRALSNEVSAVDIRSDDTRSFEPLDTRMIPIQPLKLKLANI
jgi:hypothetical protein